nr:calmodulin-interacting protein 111 isoform X1 [Tanacetum cinerariifolium]
SDVNHTNGWLERRWWSKGVKMQLMEAVEWPQKHQDAFRHIGTRTPSDVLIFGPPGCRKTLLAHVVIADETYKNILNHDFKITLSGSRPAFKEKKILVLKYVDHGTIGSCSGAAGHF